MRGGGWLLTEVALSTKELLRNLESLHDLRRGCEGRLRDFKRGCVT